MHRQIIVTLSICGVVILSVCGCVDKRLSPSVRPTPIPQQTLAVLPWSLGIYQEHIAFNAMRDVLMSNLAGSPFDPVMSVYDLPGHAVTHLEATAIRKYGVLWPIQDGRRPPDYDVAFKAGAALGVDAVLLYAGHLTYGFDEMAIYLLDIKEKRRFMMPGETFVHEDEIPKELALALRAVFAKYINAYTGTAGG